MTFFHLSEGMENCKIVREKSGKSQGILRWMISGNPVYSWGLHLKNLLILLMEKICSYRSKFFPLRVDPMSKSYIIQ